MQTEQQIQQLNMNEKTNVNMYETEMFDDVVKEALEEFSKEFTNDIVYNESKTENDVAGNVSSSPSCSSPDDSITSSKQGNVSSLSTQASPSCSSPDDSITSSKLSQPPLKYTKKEDEAVKQVLDQLTFNGYKRDGTPKPRKSRLRIGAEAKKQICMEIATLAGVDHVRRWKSIITHYNNKLAEPVDGALKTRKRSLSQVSVACRQCGVCQSECDNQCKIVVEGKKKYLCKTHSLKALDFLINNK